MFLDDLAQYLDDAGLGSNTDATRTIFTDYTPDLPTTEDPIIVLTRYGGMPPERIQETRGIAYEKPRVQVKVRSRVYDSGDQLIEKVFDTLVRLQNTELGGTYYRGIIPLQTPFFLRRDIEQRAEFIFNCQVEKERTVA